MVFIRDVDLSILFFSLCLTGVRAVLASQNEFGSIPSSSVFVRV